MNGGSTSFRYFTPFQGLFLRDRISRENSRGAHYREDFPDVGSLEESYFTVARSSGGSVEVTREPVEFSIIKPGQSLLDEEKSAAEN